MPHNGIRPLTLQTFLEMATRTNNIWEMKLLDLHWFYLLYLSIFEKVFSLSLIFKYLLTYYWSVILLKCKSLVSHTNSNAINILPLQISTAKKSLHSFHYATFTLTSVVIGLNVIHFMSVYLSKKYFTLFIIYINIVYTLIYSIIFHSIIIHYLCFA